MTKGGRACAGMLGEGRGIARRRARAGGGAGYCGDGGRDGALPDGGRGQGEGRGIVAKEGGMVRYRKEGEVLWQAGEVQTSCLFFSRF